MESIKNPTLKKAIKIGTLAGASILVAGSVVQLTRAKKMSEVIFPAITILVGVSAFAYAMQKAKTNEPTSSAAGSGQRIKKDIGANTYNVQYCGVVHSAPTYQAAQAWLTAQQNMDPNGDCSFTSGTGNSNAGRKATRTR